MDEYEKLASDLLEWIQRTRPMLEDRTTDNTISNVQERLDQFRDYRRNQKPPRADQKGELESSYNTLQARIANFEVADMKLKQIKFTPHTK